jgi:hypothetical protein
MLEWLNRLDMWLAIFALGALAFFELRLGRFVGPIVRGFLNVAGPAMEDAVEQVRRRRARHMPTVRLKPRPIRDDVGRFNGSLPAETNGNEDEDRFDAVSVIATPEDDAETVAFRFLARLVKAGHVTETQALESACEVKAGSSKAYQEARAKLKRALEDQNKNAIVEELQNVA